MDVVHLKIFVLWFSWLIGSLSCSWSWWSCALLSSDAHGWSVGLGVVDIVACVFAKTCFDKFSWHLPCAEVFCNKNEAFVANDGSHILHLWPILLLRLVGMMLYLVVDDINWIVNLLSTVLLHSTVMYVEKYDWRAWYVVFCLALCKISSTAMIPPPL
jgi:hypothetical protein